ncbi:hypothetical protein [Streptomyces sp. NBC_00076]|uniref:hypothetical protein n=1 Tax=Streptomyces sp. NBC_00076 TaxID=2975642 RepID=UPI003246C667
MNSRTQRRRRDAWWATPIAALCPALAALLTALVMCLGSPAHETSGHASAAPSMAAMITAKTPAGSWPTHHVVASAHPGDCHSGDERCAQSAHGGRAVLPAAPQPLPVVLPRVPSLAAPAASARAPGPSPTRSAPGLHVLQVQRI